MIPFSGVFPEVTECANLSCYIKDKQNSLYLICQVFISKTHVWLKCLCLEQALIASA